MVLLQTRSALVVLVAIASFWFGFTILSGSLTSGYHFMDDHEIVRIHSALQSGRSPFELMAPWLQDDFANGRFRPLYYPHRILATWILGVHWWLWSVYVALLGIWTTWGLSLWGRQLQWNWGESLLLATLTTLGPQAAVWWQLGPPETLGMAIATLALLLTVKSTQPGPHQWLWTVLWVGVAIALSLSKESFILFIPALVGLRLGLAWQQGAGEQALRRHLWSGLLLGGVVLAELLVIKQVIGLSGPGYGGVVGLKPQEIWQALGQLSQVGSGWIGWVGWLGLLGWAYQHRRFTAKPLGILLLFGLIVVPQTYLYAKTGISHRYLLPGILGYALLNVWVYRELALVSVWLRRLVLGLLVASLAWQLHTTWGEARRFAGEGRSTQALLRSLETNTQRDSPLLLVSQPRSYAEWSLALKSYLTGISDRPNLYLQVYSGQDSPFYAFLERVFEQRTAKRLGDLSQAQCITILPDLHNAFLKRSTDWFRPQAYQHWGFGPYYRAINPHSEIHLYCKKSQR